MAPLPHTSETGTLGVRHLKRFRARTLAGRSLKLEARERATDWVADNTLLCGLRVGLRETLQYLSTQSPTLEEFEAWIVQKNGGRIDTGRIERINLGLSGGVPECVPPGEPVLTAEDLAFWEENGYVVLHDAVPPENCAAAERAIYEFLHMDPEKPDTWYGGPQGHSIWIPLQHDAAFWANRDSPRIQRAFAQLWGRPDMWCSVDQGGMNPPERPGWRFPGPHLHWDVSLALPIPFGVQGILYLTDTAADQGAFVCVPGFHRRIEDWLRSLPEGADPRTQDLSGLGAIPIAGRAGDLIIWHHALPHGSSPNRARVPRVAQYIKMQPSQWGDNPVWK
jgi:hypothetical protein